MSKKKNNLNYIPASAKTAAQKKEEAKQNKGENLSPEMRAKLLKKRAWTLSVISLCFVLVLTLSILFGSYTPTYYNEKTNTAPESTITSGIISNQEFNYSSLLYNGESSDALQQPYLPSEWTLSETVATSSVAGIVSRDSAKEAKVKADLKAVGITNESDISKILDDSDATSDKNVLLMYNKTSSNVRAYSNSFSVAANNYLKVTVRVRTNVVAGDGAFIALKTSASDSKTAELSFTGINHADWKEYTFFVEGSKTSSQTLYLFVGFGTSSSQVSGWAEFDYAKAESIKKVDYINQTKDTTSTVIKTKSYVNDMNEDDKFEDVDVWTNSTVPSMQGATINVGEISSKYELPFYNKDILSVYEVSNTSSKSWGT